MGQLPLTPEQEQRRRQQQETAGQRAVDRAAEMLRNNVECANFIAELIYQTSQIAGPETSLITPILEPIQGQRGTLEPSFGPEYANGAVSSMSLLRRCGAPYAP